MLYQPVSVTFYDTGILVIREEQSYGGFPGYYFIDPVCDPLEAFFAIKTPGETDSVKTEDPLDAFLDAEGSFGGGIQGDVTTLGMP